ncbi:hypothetical protein D3C78_1273210 [compost metagenome]
MAVEPFEVTAQHEQRLAQRRQLAVSLLTGTGRDVGGQQQNLLGQQLGTGQLDQLEDAADLLQVLDRLLQQADVEPIGNEQLQAMFGLLDGGEQLAAHQTEGRGSSYHWLSPPPARYACDGAAASPGPVPYWR